METHHLNYKKNFESLLIQFAAEHGVPNILERFDLTAVYDKIHENIWIVELAAEND